MSKILGFGTNGYRNYEKGEVPSLANGKLINTVLDSVETFKSLVEINNDITAEERDNILDKINIYSKQYEKNLIERNFINYAL